jgi:aryl-alcohol dehydrogenase-like predicted oxidoreductase
MNYTEIANSGVHVSAIGFGTVKIGRDMGVKYPHGFTIPDDQQVLHLLSLCRELGINLLDTAPAYGTSEERLGLLLKSSERQDWVINSKAGEEFDSQSGLSKFDFSAAAITKSVERSLKKLNTDYIDIVMIHSDGNDLKIIEQDLALDTLAKLKKQGKVRAIGMSTKTIEGGISALQQSDCAMVTYNLQTQAELPVIEFAQSHNKGIFIKKAFASGHLDHALNDPILASLELIFRQSSVNSAVIGTITAENLVTNVEKYLQAIENISSQGTYP